MVHKLYSIYDSAVEMYNHPMFCKTQGEAIRAFMNMSNDKTTRIAQNPADYTLFFIGEWDDETGRFSPEITPKSLGLAQEHIQS